eukprot:TRINITY_DN12644_c0_g1_i2.p1 TRINITY_DN12644_c0_g1~~TRINITY_DN12644_c0_g1_i2.p1  ORF type:complete len:108 (+),score=37.48 TRINITY_DN12644_c0_g1_i2:374-697(+)
MTPKDMATGTIRRKQQQLREEEMDADTLEEEWSAKCGVCGLRKMSMSNTNILCDLEDGESWRKLEAEDDYCYCEADPGDDITEIEKKEKEKRSAPETEADKRKRTDD